jgi:translation elongation factor P/translation initiation factor 5A
MNIKQLSKFLVKAKINTYVSSGEGEEIFFQIEIKNLSLKRKNSELFTSHSKIRLFMI